MKDNTILAKLKKFDCDIDNLTNYQNACGECRVCKYLEFLDYAGSVGMPGESTVEYNKEIDRYLEIREFYKSLLAKKMEEVIPDLKKAYEIGGSGEEYPFIEEHKEMNKLISKYKQ